MNQLAGVDITASGEDTQTIENYYSAQGKRIRKVENGDTTKYSYEGDEVLFTTTGDAFMLTENILDTQGSIIASKRFADPFDDKYYLYNYDLRESVTTIIKPDGTRVKDYTYDESGNMEEGGDQDFLNETTYTDSGCCPRTILRLQFDYAHTAIIITIRFINRMNRALVMTTH